MNLIIIFDTAGNPFKINKNMIMDEVVMDEVSLAGQGSNFGTTGQPVRGVKRQAESPLMNNAINTKRQRKGKPKLAFVAVILSRY
jgi:hypothetical protein